MASYHKMNMQQLKYIYESPLGPMARELTKQGIKVQSAARKNLNGGVSGPRRVNTGLLRTSINTELGADAQGLVVKVGTKLHYAIYIHEGTGIYGPKKRVIKPRVKKFMAFKSKRYGAKKGKWKGWVFATEIKGIKPNRFLTTAVTDVFG